MLSRCGVVQYVQGCPAMMKTSSIGAGLRRALLGLAGLLMAFAAFVNATEVVPHLRGDLLEIHVRPTLVSAILLALYFGIFAMTGFALLVLAAAAQREGAAALRVPLLMVALTYMAFGAFAFVWNGSPHMLGYVLMGVLVGVACFIREEPERP
ncbi:MAG: hypothetical protein DMF53_28010 [Acidobacteria bacterium]|nr:MAG: hypothetical protein DMF53_28010 [Acidobacteriota bacterium]